ncbi:hypothetical protein E3N88_34169 [Mikania micrantha]|uniref:Cysteine proteinase inhibitor n=1 Tax=Mikania micrantha TaxID=192012 RepID=A0A5N6MG60_9ASTR|nr:hypothetical protein E3N88_34169 [Mikania micrantha]
MNPKTSSFVASSMIISALLQTSFLKFGRLVKVKEQVVAGVIYYLTFEAYDGGNTKVYEAKVWVKPWMNFKQLQEFKLSSVR